MTTVLLIAAVVHAACAAVPADEEGVRRSFLYLEFVSSAVFPLDGATGLPPGDRSKDYVELSPRPPGNSIGLDYVRTFSTESLLNRRIFGGWMPLEAMTLHPRIVYDRMQDNRGMNAVKFAPQDFWIRWNPGGSQRLSLRLGQFVIPYGMNPMTAPRHRFLLPLEAADLGLKWDWGLNIKGPLGKLDWEAAATLGLGEGLHSPRLSTASERTSFLLTARLGAPTYWDIQNGLSILVGDLPAIMGPSVFGAASISRWRVAYDLFRRSGDYLILSGQVACGQDGFGDDAQYVAVTGGQRSNVLGVRATLEWIIPRFQNAGLSWQVESVRRDTSTHNSDDTAALYQFSYSFTNAVSVFLAYREEANRVMAPKSDAVYLTFVYYGR
ncbi:MAG: hypothetical protein A3G34_06450 [Candidatus Lindowbacteria bacterium RIFCSPLOWO2_12_FULL_62_27]|nr:MAG: hypothetical protein A3G34_06450 [Candidatus Lindowbacteria bacterium RIFCSPLOWO2_12_FULL_62_27]OGH63729.1 MAG: hypothetical protein A3I06_01155 [Candidatus Lindowbacteria bacterium RIFCSPLOWO2_02_FULL_62_12]